MPNWHTSEQFANLTRSPRRSDLKPRLPQPYERKLPVGALAYRYANGNVP